MQLNPKIKNTNIIARRAFNHQFKACSYRERHGHAGHRYRRHEKQVSGVEDCATEESLHKTTDTCGI